MIGTDSPHAQRRRPGHARHRRGRRRRRRRHGRPALGGQCAQAHRRAAHRRAVSGWTAPKDVILKVAGILTVKGGTDRIVEYFGPGRATPSAAPARAPSATWAPRWAPPPALPLRRAHGRLPARHRAAASSPIWPSATADLLAPDPEVAAKPGATSTTRSIEIDLVRARAAPGRTAHAGSGAADLRVAEAVADRRATPTSSCCGADRQLHQLVVRGHRPRDRRRAGRRWTHGLKTKAPLHDHARLRADPRDHRARRPDRARSRRSAARCWPTPAARASASGSATTIAARAQRQLRIVTSYNRNFPRRNDGNAATPRVHRQPRDRHGLWPRRATSSFNPLTDTLRRRRRQHGFKLDAARRGASCRPSGFDARPRTDLPVRRPTTPSTRRGAGQPDSERLQLLEPFAAWDGKDFDGPAAAAQGQGQVHHRPHLPGRARGSVTAATWTTSATTCSSARSTPSPARPARRKNQLTGETRHRCPTVARAYKAAGMRWVVVGDENYGEGSTREHAAHGAAPPRRRAPSSRAASRASTRPT